MDYWITAEIDVSARRETFRVVTDSPREAIDAIEKARKNAPRYSRARYTVNGQKVTAAALRSMSEPRRSLRDWIAERDDAGFDAVTLVCRLRDFGTGEGWPLDAVVLRRDEMGEYIDVAKTVPCLDYALTVVEYDAKVFFTGTEWRVY